MSWAVVFTKKNDTKKEDYLEIFTYSKERAEELAKKYNANTTDKEYRATLCETF